MFYSIKVLLSNILKRKQHHLQNVFLLFSSLFSSHIPQNLESRQDYLQQPTPAYHQVKDLQMKRSPSGVCLLSFWRLILKFLSLKTLLSHLGSLSNSSQAIMLLEYGILPKSLIKPGVNSNDTFPLLSTILKS